MLHICNHRDSRTVAVSSQSGHSILYGIGGSGLIVVLGEIGLFRSWRTLIILIRDWRLTCKLFKVSWNDLEKGSIITGML